ncbi:phage tail tape measure protein [Desulfosporosinus meridiei]|uniref:Phage-related minor tail protein n=1 Tax=Desulfosporosinus meridiei (strain ATCC BAA-275 / DSM 13257 / KCTC 12902 / NCIMB 13706 / S10) TaxID=768704 RepID=J7J5P5_DESMD|nr:phage tail tape measure protein [Desulfosporosinus meridiei]AFQ46261.1 Phage-related minor tail protein [Desulfosporosinus meridiei DSM 13257]
MTQNKQPFNKGCFSYAIEWEVVKIEIFRLFGSILIDNDAANARIDDTDRRAQGTAKTFGEMVSSAAKVGAGIVLAMGTAALAVGGLAVSFSDDLKKALNGIQAETGVTDEAMIGMKDTLLEIYNANLGENFEDIAKAMAEVGKQTGATGEELEDMTKDALMLRDTFEFEVAESTRTADMMMKRFGITSDEAFNLIAQGAQQGLDKNGNLLDSINEYSVHFEQLGFNSEEMFNMMANGAATGVFDIDKLGDAMKEFGIRSKDGSKASTEAFQALGLDAGKMSLAFAQGGDSAKEAFDKTAQAIFALEDPLAKEAAGVALFGTMWEDIGAKGMEALTNTQGGISKTTDALGKINEVKYDTFGLAIQGIKRNMETSILIPLGEKVMPKVNEFTNLIITNMPLIKNEIEYAFTVAGRAIDEAAKTISGIIDWFVQYQAIIVPIVGAVAAVVINAWIVMGIEAAKTAIVNGIASAKVVADWLLMGLKSTAHALVVVASWAATGVGAVAAVTILVVQSAIVVAKWAWMGVQSLLHAAKMASAWVMAMGPVAWVTAAVMALAVLIIANWETVKTKTIEIFGGISTWLSTTWEAIKAYISAKVLEIKTDISNAWEAIKTAIYNKMEAVRTTIVEKWNQSQQFLQDIDLMQIGQDIIRGLINGISNKLASLKGTVEEMASSLPNWIKKILGIHSPSTVLQEVGQYTIDGLILGIGNKASAVGAAMDNIVGTVTSKASAFVTAGTTIGQQFSEALQSSIKEPTYSSGSGGGSSGGSSGTSITNVKGVGNVVETNGQVTINTKSGSYNEKTGQYSITNYKTGQTLYRNGSKEEYEENYAKFHEGGWVGLDLRPDEVPIIAQRGEFVLSKKMIEGRVKSSASAGNADNSKAINQTVNIYSPAAVSPAETARQNKRALQELALAF